MPSKYEKYPQDNHKMSTTVEDDENESSNSYSGFSPSSDSVNVAPKRDEYLRSKRKLLHGFLPLKGKMIIGNRATGFISQANVTHHIVSDPNFITNASSMKGDSLEQSPISESSGGCGSDVRTDDVKDHVKSLASHELLQDFSEDAKSVVSCKICGHSGYQLEMLLCDLCEESFHLSCCIPKLRQPPVEDWHCRSCSEKEQKLLSDKKSKEVSGISGRWNRSSGHIQNILRDHRPYTTRVSIGNDFQAEIPEQIDLIHGASVNVGNDSGNLGEPSELDPTDQYGKPSGWIYSNPEKSTSMSNWVQCHAVIKISDSRRIVCGKWRRAPLDVEQTKHWDCSCAVRWDPMHSDCAVPQELETKEVVEHLKFIRKVKGKLANKLASKSNVSKQ